MKVHAQPEDGKANAAVISVLAKALELPKSHLTLTAGHKERLKTVIAKGDTAALEHALQEIVRRAAASVD